MKQKTLKILQHIFVALLVIGSVYYAVRDIDFYLLWQILKSADYVWVLLSIPIMILSHWIRAIRWKTLLKPVLDAKSTWNLFSAVMIGYAVNNVLPRGGEFVRPIVYARREKVSISAVFATIFIERFLDLVFLLGLFAIVFFLNRGLISKAFPYMTDYNLIMFVVLPVVMLFVMILLSLYTKIGHLALKYLVKPFSEKLYNKAESMLESFLKGMEFFRTPSHYLKTLVDSSLLWLFYALPMYLMFFSFSFQDHLNLGVLDAGLLLIVTGIGVTIAPTPGAIGIYHSIVLIAMTNLYSITKEEALAYATLVHAINMLVQVVIGVAFLLKENIKKLPSKDDLDIQLNQDN